MHWQVRNFAVQLNPEVGALCREERRSLRRQPPLELAAFH